MTKNQPDILQIPWKTRLETLLCWAVCELKRRVKVAYSCRSDSICDFSESILEGKQRLHVFRFGVIRQINLKKWLVTIFVSHFIIFGWEKLQFLVFKLSFEKIKLGSYFQYHRIFSEKTCCGDFFSSHQLQKRFENATEPFFRAEKAQLERSRLDGTSHRGGLFLAPFEFRFLKLTKSKLGDVVSPKKISHQLRNHVKFLEHHFSPT